MNKDYITSVGFHLVGDPLNILSFYQLFILYLLKNVFFFFPKAKRGVKGQICCQLLFFCQIKHMYIQNALGVK